MNKQETIFNKQDVLKVVRAMLGNHIEYGERNGQAYYSCFHCDKSACQGNMDNARITHKLNCPVLVARDLLT